MRQPQAAFTLIELLVVISIIAILASMLMPAIGMVRSSARTINCGNNMRQFTLAMLTYTNDNDSMLPIGEWNPLVENMMDGSFAACMKIARCPSAPVRTTNGTAIYSTYAYTGVYWASWTVGPDFATPKGALFAWPFWINAPFRNSIAGMTRMSEKCMLSENWHDQPTTVAGNTAWGVNYLNDQSVRLVHNSSNNFAFADGHIQMIAVPGVAKFGLTQWAGDSMWRPYNPLTSVKAR